MCFFLTHIPCRKKKEENSKLVEMWWGWWGSTLTLGFPNKSCSRTAAFLVENAPWESWSHAVSSGLSSVLLAADHQHGIFLSLGPDQLNSLNCCYTYGISQSWSFTQSWHCSFNVTFIMWQLRKSWSLILSGSYNLLVLLLLPFGMRHVSLRNMS